MRHKFFCFSSGFACVSVVLICEHISRLKSYLVNVSDGSLRFHGSCLFTTSVISSVALNICIKLSSHGLSIPHHQFFWHFSPLSDWLVKYWRPSA